MFALMTDLERFGDWMVFHDGWQGEAPAPSALKKGLKATSLLNVKGQVLPFDWTIDAYDPVKQLRFSGKEKGVKVSIALGVRTATAGSDVSFSLELTGLPVVGPIGKAVVKQLAGDVELSLDRLCELALN